MRTTTRRSVLSAGALLALTTSLAAGCALPTSDAQSQEEGAHTTVRYQGSANAVTWPELADDLGYLDRVQLEYVGATTSGPQDIQSVATGQTDIGGAFSGAIVKLVEAGYRSPPSSPTTARTRGPTRGSTSARTAPSAGPVTSSARRSRSTRWAPTPRRRSTRG